MKDALSKIIGRGIEIFLCCKNFIPLRIQPRPKNSDHRGSHDQFLTKSAKRIRKRVYYLCDLLGREIAFIIRSCICAVCARGGVSAGGKRQFRIGGKKKVESAESGGYLAKGRLFAILFSLSPTWIIHRLKKTKAQLSTRPPLSLSLCLFHFSFGSLPVLFLPEERTRGKKPVYIHIEMEKKNKKKKKK